MLDADEYLHLAINASQAGNHHAALEHLHKALDQAPGHTAARYFLAAEHAELGLYERACKEMEELLLIAPDMAIACFQLGLLNLQLERPQEARQAFSNLSESTTDESLRDFSRAYIHLLDEQQREAMDLLSQGISTCSNPALKADMARVLASLSTSQADQAVTDGSPAPVYLGAYRTAEDTP